ncbi:hypothetical protein MKW92_031180 [Papaver armeniacum]|nr:hypothetical protein MKW92_031180 [Papaver armeniacum]
MLFGGMQRAGIELDQVAMVAALSACAELGDLKLGRRIHSYIAKGSDGITLQQSVSLTNAIVHMYASCGAIEEAYRAFRGDLAHENAPAIYNMASQIAHQSV